jgi:hypothetical protein
VVARWGGEEFVVGAYLMPASGMRRRLDEALERRRSEGAPGAGEAGAGVSFSAGVAERRAPGDDLQRLYRAADEALYRAKAAGRARVLLAGADESAAEHVDVALVEDDEALAEILQHALHTAGLSVRWLDDGAEARALLGGARFPLTARLVILDAAVRAESAGSLGRLGHWPAAAPLYARLGDPAWAVRRAAALSLRRLGPPGLLMLRRGREHDDPFGRDMARQVLDLPDTAAGAR